MRRWRRVRKHECWPPTGMVFDPIWQCPTCGDHWTLVEKANHTEWIRDA
jgi:hypothetical protein